MDSIGPVIAESRIIQFIGLFVLTFIYLISFPFTDQETFFDFQAIFDFTFLGLPRAHDIVTKLNNGTIDFQADHSFPYKLTFTKESVNAWHNYNYSDWSWDYHERPRPEFKSFFGPLLASFLALPWSFNSSIYDKRFVQTMTRLSVSILVLIAFAFYCSSVSRKYGHYTASALTILTMSQFYFMFNISRLIPNCLSLVMVLFTSSAWLSKRYTTFLVLACITVVNFDSVTIFLFLPMSVHSMFVQKNLSSLKFFYLSLCVGYLSLAPTLFDSYMWGMYVWPQSTLFENLIHKPTNGIDNFLWYNYYALPRYLLSSLIFVPFASRRCIKSALVVAYSYLALCSLFGYKNFNLVIYCCPLLNTCAANTIAIHLYRFFTLQSHPESWLLYVIRRKLGYPVTPLDEYETQERLMDELEQHLDNERRRRRHAFTLNQNTNDVPYEYEQVAPTDYPPPYDEAAPSRSPPPQQHHPEPLSPTSPDVRVSFHPNSSPRSRQSPQSSPTNFLRRRGGLRKPHIPTNCTDREAAAPLTAAVVDNNGQSTSYQPRRIPVEAENIQSVAHKGSLVTVFVALHLIFNGAASVYIHTTFDTCFPGGQAIIWLNQHINFTDLTVAHPKDIGVYVGKYAIETGYTRFLQFKGITYDTSPNLYTMATRSQRLYKHRDFTNRRFDHKPKSDGYDMPEDDFKVIYFILDHIEYLNFATQCISKRRRPEGLTTTTAPPLATIGITIPNPKMCSLSHELKECALIKTFESYNGVKLNRERMSLQVVTKPTIWIFRCYTGDLMYR